MVFAEFVSSPSPVLFSISEYEPFLVYVCYAAISALLLIAALLGWNRTLSKLVLQRTAAMAESEERFRQIAENIHEVFWLFDFDADKVIYASPAYEVVWQASRETLYREPHAFLAAIHPDDRSSAIEAMEKHRENGFDVEYRLVRPDGSIRWIRDRGFPTRDGTGRVYRLAGIAEDITDRKLAADTLKQADDRVRLNIDTIPTMVWSVRPDGVVDFVNQPWLDFTGLSIDGALQNPNSIVHPEDMQRVLDKWLRDLAANRPSEDEMRLRRADGEYRWFLVRTVPLLDEHGNIIRWYGAGTDLEDRRNAEEKLMATTEQLRALSARLHFAREEEGIRIAREIHDGLGATLTSLRWELEGFKKSLLESEARVPAAELKPRLANMFGLIDSMVNIVRGIASDLRPAVLDILGLEEAIEWQAQQFQDRTGITIRYELPDHDIDLSPEQSIAVFRIFQETLTNVLRHARATTVDVTVAAEAGTFVLCVKDNGRGITGDEKHGPLSIGLLGMRERAHLLGGEVDITGIDGGGTTLSVRFPLR
ncbi:MAG: PAS domain-containing protein [Thermoanaerobaculia bacterium]